MRSIFSNKFKDNKSLVILIFLGLFGFAIGIFSNYRELWMDANGIPAASIGRVISLASIITVLVFFLFTSRVSFKNLKNGLTVCLLLKMITSALLICLDGKGFLFGIKFLIFFNIAFEEIILSSIYPLIMQITKNDVVYTKKNVVESLSSKLGFLIASIIVGKTIFGHLFDYNSCLLISIIFIFLSFVVFLNIKVPANKENNPNDMKGVWKYLRKNKVLIYFLFVNALGSLVWSSIIGMRMLSLTNIIGVKTNIASYLVLVLGVLSNGLAMLIVKHLKSKNDHINLFFKYGFRVILYFLVFLTNSKTVLLCTFICLLLTDMPYGFIFGSYFLHKIKEEYSLIFATIKYCSNLLGSSIGVFICGLTFNLPIKYIGLTTFFLSVIQYILAIKLIDKKKDKLND